MRIGGKHIVGHKTETYLTKRRGDYGWIITQQTVVSELHATKGWRRVSSRKQEYHLRPGSRPLMAEWRRLTPTTFERTMPRRKRPDYWVHHHDVELARERHGWYWRKMRKEMVGFFAGLTDEQKRDALAYRGEAAQ